MTSLSKLEILRAHSLPSLVQEEVLRMIKTGELPAGARLNELDLALRLRISRAPLREAMRALEEAGLVRQERHRGMFVREIAATEARELYEVRAALDEQAGRLLAPRIAGDELAELSARLDELEACGADELDRTFPLNIAFHDRLVELAGNATLLTLYRQIINRLHLLRRRSFAAGNEASHREHRAILAALATRAPDAAAAALRAHVFQGFDRMRAAEPAAAEATSPASEIENG